MHTKTTTILAVILGFLSCSSPVLAAGHHKPRLTIKTAEQAVIRSEQKYWKGKPIKLYLDSCWHITSQKVRCEIEIEGSFYNIVSVSSSGETVETPSPPVRVSETDDALLRGGKIRIYYGTT
jgi:hypothetical protein